MPRRRRSRTAEHRALIRAHRKHYDELLAFQGGHCALCPRTPDPKRRLAMDHDHKTMEIRGLLCTACNMRLSQRHTREWLRAAANYLEDPPWDALRRSLVN